VPETQTEAESQKPTSCTLGRQPLQTRLAAFRSGSCSIVQALGLSASRQTRLSPVRARAFPAVPCPDRESAAETALQARIAAECKGIYPPPRTGADRLRLIEQDPEAAERLLSLLGEGFWVDTPFELPAPDTSSLVFNGRCWCLPRTRRSSFQRQACRYRWLAMGRRQLATYPRCMYRNLK
jgi:hypothetical protein